MQNIFGTLALILLLHSTVTNSASLNSKPTEKRLKLNTSDLIPWSSNSFIQSIINRSKRKEQPKNYIRLIDRKKIRNNSTGTKPRLNAGELINWQPNSMILHAIKLSNQKPEQPTSHIRYVDPRQPKSQNRTTQQFTVKQLIPWTENSIMREVKAITSNQPPNTPRIRLIDAPKQPKKEDKKSPRISFSHRIIPWQRNSNLAKILHYAHFSPPPPPYPVSFPIFSRPLTTQQNSLELFNDYLARPVQVVVKYLPETLNAARVMDALSKASQLLG